MSENSLKRLTTEQLALLLTQSSPPLGGEQKMLQVSLNVCLDQVLPSC